MKENRSTQTEMSVTGRRAEAWGRLELCGRSESQDTSAISMKSNSRIRFTILVVREAAGL